VSGKCETLEHLRRKSDGGTNAIDNMALACATCNQSRGGLDWLTYKTMKMGEAHR
jgi:5-methylcytosine-specific restriction endonuclease McrA